MRRNTSTQFVLLIVFFFTSGGCMVFGQSENWKTLSSMFDKKSYSYKKYWDKYHGISKSLAMEIPKEQLWEVVVDYCSFVVGESFGEDQYKKLEKMPNLIRKAYLVYWFEAELNNGGLHQYFFNSTGYDVLDAVESLEYFGPRKNATLLREAYELIAVRIDERTFKEMQVSRTLPMDDLFESFSKIEERFFWYEEKIADSVRDKLDRSRVEISTK